MTIAITGVTGNMGQAVLAALRNANCITKIKLLARNKKRIEKLLNRHKDMRNRIDVVFGTLDDKKAIESLIDGADLVINMAAVIPPLSDRNPKGAVLCNEIGTDILVSAMEQVSPCPALIHISTIAVYGDRSAGHPFVRVGDPLLASPLDVYSATKLRSEFRVLESNIPHRAVLRQSAMLHPRMLTDNMHDGLMFHTVFNCPLEWVTAHDSGLLIRNIAIGLANNTIPETFWRRCYNVAGGKPNRQYGIQTFDCGFEIIGGNAKLFLKPGYNAARNFHGGWFLDGDELNNMFDYQRQTAASYWREVVGAHKIFKLGKIVPKALIRFFVFGKLLKNSNSPNYWAKHGETARIIAHFGSKQKYDELQKTKWCDVPLLDPYSIKNLSDNDTPVYYGFDFSKPDREITQADLESVATAHGGEFLGTYHGDMYEKYEWKTQDGEIFYATPYTVLRAGHWYNPIYYKFVWEFDRLAKKDLVFASVWYDNHERDENIKYFLDDDYKACAEKSL